MPVFPNKRILVRWAMRSAEPLPNALEFGLGVRDEIMELYLNVRDTLNLPRVNHIIKDVVFRSFHIKLEQVDLVLSDTLSECPKADGRDEDRSFGRKGGRNAVGCHSRTAVR